MTKLLKKVITMLLVVTCLVGTFAGCSSSSNEKETKEAVTTQKKVEETTTEAPTEEPTTEPYVKFGEFSIKEQYADYFYDLVIENGSVIIMNEVIPDDDTYRGNKAHLLLSIFNIDYTDFIEKYFAAQNAIIPYEDNYCIEYTGPEKLIFKFTHNNNYGISYFDIYELK